MTISNEKNCYPYLYRVTRTVTSHNPPPGNLASRTSVHYYFFKNTNALIAANKKGPDMWYMSCIFLSCKDF